MKTPAKTDGLTGLGGPNDRQKARAERLAAELRANLKRRKAAARGRDGQTAQVAQDLTSNGPANAENGDGGRSDASA